MIFVYTIEFKPKIKKHYAIGTQSVWVLAEIFDSLARQEVLTIPKHTISFRWWKFTSLPLVTMI